MGSPDRRARNNSVVPVFFGSICFLPLFAAFLMIAASAMSEYGTLFLDDFERGVSSKWQPAPKPEGPWRIIAEPENPGNHVLAVSLTNGGGSQIAFGETGWKDYRLSGRLKVLESKGGFYHVKFGVRSREPEASYCLNARDTGPWLIHHSGKDFIQLGPVGDFGIHPGRWYGIEVECAGFLLTGRVRDGKSNEVLGELRCMESSLAAGRCYLSAFMPQGASATFLFDDIRVEAVQPPTAVESRLLTIESQAVRVEFDQSTGRFDIVDLRTQQHWPQTPLGASLPVVEPAERRADGRRLQAKLKTSAGTVELTLSLEEPAEVLMALRPSLPGRRATLAYPNPLLPPSENAELVMPADEGVLLPVTAVDFPRVLGHYSYQQHGVLMPWFGLVEGERGVMALVETADDMQFNVGKTAQTGKPLLTPGVVWLPSRDDLRYERRVRFCVFDRGGYVAMAKRYRKFLTDTGRFRTLADKAKEVSDVNKLLGAIAIYDHSGARGGVLDWMIAKGIRRALYYGAPDKARNEKALAAGYVTGRYDLYTDIATPELLAMWGPPKSPNDHRKIGYPDEAFVTRDGKLQLGFAYPVGVKGGVLAEGQELKTIRCVSRCSATKQAWLQKNVPTEAAQQALRSRFIDVETATAPTECYSDKHPLTRTEDIQTRIKLFDYLRSIGQIAASEGGADWPAHALHYQEGSLTLNHFAYPKGVYVGTAPFDLPDEYVAVQFGMARRVPLHKLVYHDSVLMTWRWNHTPNRWVKGAEHWDDWDLIHILYGGMPIFVVNDQTIKDKGERILQSHRNICGVLEKIAGSEMLSHRFLTPDRQVQETRFANGWAVVVNFGKEKPYSREGGEPVAPRSFATYRWQ